MVGRREGNESSLECGEMVDAFFALAAFGSMNGSTLLSVPFRYVNKEEYSLGSLRRFNGGRTR
jgi:hypothetical protein